MAVDDTYAPIIDDQLAVFESAYPDAHVEVVYKPEIQAVNLLMSGGVRVAVLARDLTPKEKEYFQSKNIVVRVNKVAIDAVSIISATSSADTALLVDDVIKVMKGLPGRVTGLVFDNANSSTVRYLKELSGVTVLPAKGVYALNSNKEVIKYVAEHPGTFGVVGMNWMEQPDSSYQQFVDRVKFIGVKNREGQPGSDAYYRPSQTTLALKTYPLLRDVYVLDCSGGGLASGFAAFVAGERGQRIVLKSGLLPYVLPSREIMIRK